jgi:hypothetical protein
MDITQDEDSSGFPWWILLVILLVLAITLIILFIILWNRKKDTIPVLPVFKIVVTNPIEVTVSWSPTDTNINSNNRITVYATSKSPVISNNVVTNPDVIKSDSVNPTVTPSVVLTGLPSNIEQYITLIITSTNANTHASSVNLVFMAVSPPPNTTPFQLEAVGIHGFVDFVTNGSTASAIPQLKTSSSTRNNNYYVYNPTVVGMTGIYSNQIVTVVCSPTGATSGINYTNLTCSNGYTGVDAGPWLLTNNSGNLQAIQASGLSSSNIPNTQWSYSNNHWCLANSPTSCLLVDNPKDVSSNGNSSLSVGQIVDIPTKINEIDVNLGQRWEFKTGNIM